MAVTISPNMTLPIPGVGTEQGPNYAFDVNASLTLIDQHDHSLGRGIQITPAGMDINVDLSFNDNSAVSLLNVAFVSQSTATTVLQALSVAPGSESPAIQDLWYTDSMGNKVQITSGGELAPVTASIEGITYASGTFFFKETQSSLPTTPANLDAGSVTVRPNTALTANGVIITPPSGISSLYNVALPLLPGATALMTLDPSGNMATGPAIVVPAGTFLAGPTSGSAAAATFRALQVPTITTLTISSTSPYTPPAGALWLRVKVQGGGGGGGGTGTGGNPGGSGGAGGTSSFGGSLIATGGGGGAVGSGGSGVAGDGGQGSGGYLNLRGNPGASLNNGGADGVFGPVGGASLFLGAGTAGPRNGNGGDAAANSGAGGGAAGGGAGLQPGSAGGAGGYVEGIIPVTSGSFAFVIGTHGAGGITGLPSGAGGAGAAGIIIIEEHYQ